MISVERKVQFARSGRSRKKDLSGEADIFASRVPRVSRLMALAIRLDQMVRDGVAADQAELARLGHVSRARLTQIMNLRHLAPDIQEALLFLPATERGRDAIAERELRPIAAIPSWSKQRLMWKGLMSHYHTGDCNK